MSTSSAEIPRAVPAVGGSRTTFVLSRPTYHLLAHGATARFDSTEEARGALADRRHTHVVGAIPFDSRRPAALTAPAAFVHKPHRWQPDPPSLPDVEIVRSEPTPEEHRLRIRNAVEVLADPSSSLAKVVLARIVHLRAHEAVDPLDLLARLVSADRNSNGMLADLTPAGPEYHGHHLVGSSPEVLVRKSGSKVICHPLAGSAPRLTEQAADHRSGQTLVESAKDQREHAFVVDAIAEALGPLCSQLDVPASPTLTRTTDLWHLGTRIEGSVRDDTIGALDLAVALHPTPAVCGTPTAEAQQYILTHEGARGFYAGAVGWCDSSGDGEWMVSIRCAELSPDGRTLRAGAGGGIVADSDPEPELAETTAKLRTILSALGVATATPGSPT